MRTNVFKGFVKSTMRTNPQQTQISSLRNENFFFSDDSWSLSGEKLGFCLVWLGWVFLYIYDILL